MLDMLVLCFFLIKYAVNILNVPEIYSGYLAFSSLKVI